MTFPCWMDIHAIVFCNLRLDSFSKDSQFIIPLSNLHFQKESSCECSKMEHTVTDTLNMFKELIRIRNNSVHRNDRVTCKGFRNFELLGETVAIQRTQ